MELGIASVAAITAIAYLLGMAVKATSVADKWIPIICGAAGLILGVVEALVSGFISSTFRDAAAFAILILVLLVRPAGIFGKNTKEKV